MKKLTTPTWENQLREARLLLLERGRAELERHALVSRNNRHRCRMCFCCACLHVLIDDNEVLAGGPSW